MASETPDDQSTEIDNSEQLRSRSTNNVQRVNELATRINNRSFEQWYRQRQFTENIREGQEYFNGPPSLTPARRLSPSKLLQCKRKIFYRQRNAPAEEPPPNGLFWIGERFEEDIALPYLADAVAMDGEYLTNSLWVDFEVETSAGRVQIKGATDPVIVDQDATPVLPTEIKTKQSVQKLTEPNRHHLAQVHAYMRGLTLANDVEISDAVILYGSRTHLDVNAFHVTFNPDFWKNIVVEWAENYTTYRLDERLPPAEPEYDWECDVCDYRERCGNGSRLFEDVGAVGLLPLFIYPRRELKHYLETHGGKLTPSLAHHYPELADQYGVYDWWCNGCADRHRWDEINWSGDVSNPPKCPYCLEQGNKRFLSGPEPENQADGEQA